MSCEDKLCSGQQNDIGWLSTGSAWSSKQFRKCWTSKNDRKFGCEKAICKMSVMFALSGTKPALWGCFNWVFSDVSQQ